MNYYFAIPVQGVLKTRKAQNRRVAFRFNAKIPQNLVESFMMDIGYTNHQYYLQTDEQFKNTNMIINYVTIRHKNATKYYSIIS